MSVNRFSHLKIHYHKRTICNQSHKLSQTTYKQTNFNFDDDKLLNVNKFYENLVTTPLPAMKLFNLHNEKGLTYGGRQLFLVHISEDFEAKQYENAPIKFQPKQAISVCFVKYSESEPKAIPINEYQGIYKMWEKR